MRSRLFALLILLAILTTGTAQADELVLAVGSGTSDTARIGYALAGLLSGSGTTVTTLESGGDTGSIRRLLAGSADLAVVDSLSAYEAVVGAGNSPSAHRRGLLAAAVVGLSVEHFLLITSSGDRDDITALSGKIVYLGPDGDPGTRAARTIITFSGIESFFEAGTNWSYGTAAELMIDGSFDGAAFSGIMPLSPVSHVTSAMRGHIVLLGIPDGELTDLRGRWPVWFPYTVPEGTYAAVDDPYETIARPILLLAAQGLETKTVTGLLSRLFEKAADPASTGLPYPLDESMTITYCPLKLHPGAADYFADHGR
jgi:TRAP transporter TAXI family solute receptor